MKLMKHITIALVLCAIPAVAVGQNVTCDECTHQVSVYYGEGGFIATAAEDAEMVTWVASCDGVTRTGELTPNDGTVSALLTGDLACMSTDKDGNADGVFELGPVMDGGWYWITMDDNSAVGGLVNKDVLDNEATMITSAGDGVKMTMGSGAVLLAETATGRVGVLPNILPAMEMDAPAANPCGFSGAGTGASPFARKVSGCEMGDRGVIVLANYTNNITGATTRVMDGDNVTRPGGSGSLTVTIDLWGNGSGHFLTEATASAAVTGPPAIPAGFNFLRGQPSVSGTARAARYTGVTYRAGMGSGPTAAELTSGTASGGVTFTSPDPDNVATVAIAADSAHCSKTNNHTATVTVYADVDATGQTQVTPSIKVAGSRANPTNPTNAGKISFNIVCPAASANMGTELVPENPFPTTE